jgi:hypothetical protein
MGDNDISILTGDFSTVIGNNQNAKKVFQEVITDNTLSNMSGLIETRIGNIFSNSGQTKADNSYNSVLTYVAAEAVLATISQTDIGNDTPSKIDANFTTLSASGDFDVATNKFTVASASGNTTIGGTLNVTGVTTLTAALGATTINASGAVGVDGDFDVATNKFTVASSSGNTTIGGTLNVTGVTTLTAALGATTINASGAVGVDGDFDVATNKFTVASSSGNTAVGGTLNVTGVTTLTAALGATTINASGAVGVDGDFDVATNKFTVASSSGNTAVGGTLNVTGVTTLTGALIANNGISSTNLTLSGNLTVNGTTTTLNTTNTTIKDNLIELNSGVTSNANDCGILIERGSTGDNAIIAWDESADEFILGTTTATASDTGNLTIAAGTLNIGDLKLGGTLITAEASELNILDGVTVTTDELNILDGDTTATSTTVTDADRVVLNDNGTMVQVAMSDIKDYTNAGITTYSTIDRDDGTNPPAESAQDPTTLTAAFNDIYAKLRKINTFLLEIDSNIDFSSGFATLDFDNTA